MQLCQKHNFSFVLWDGDNLFDCPFCGMHKKYEDLEAELKEIKQELTDLNLKMYPEPNTEDPREDR